jgi:hypothetical protein
VERVPGLERRAPAGAGGVGLGGKVGAVVGQGVQPRRPGGQPVGDRDARVGERGQEMFMLGGFGAFLPDPLGDVLDGVALVQGAEQPGGGVGVVVDYVDGINRSFGFMQGGLSFGWFAEVG